jgi:hypothetical protein
VGSSTPPMKALQRAREHDVRRQAGVLCDMCGMQLCAADAGIDGIHLSSGAALQLVMLVAATATHSWWQ